MGPRCVMVSALDFRSECRWFDTQSQKLYLTLSLSIQVYKWEPATYCWGYLCDGLAYIIHGRVAMLSFASCYRNRVKTPARVGHLGSWATLPLPYKAWTHEFVFRNSRLATLSSETVILSIVINILIIRRQDIQNFAVMNFTFSISNLYGN